MVNFAYSHVFIQLMHLSVLAWISAKKGGQKLCRAPPKLTKLPNLSQARHPPFLGTRNTAVRNVPILITALDGSKMAPGEVHYVYKETRLNLEPQSSSSIVTLRVPPSSNSHSRINGSRLLANGHNSNSISDDERAYRVKNLGTASSIYRRKHHEFPRGFLWRVLENETVLSIRVADVCKEQKESDATLILHLRFDSPLRTSCIGFADYEEHDALTVFAIDHANVLHSITLRPDFFRKRVATDVFAEAYKAYSPPGFGFKHPHRLVAVSPDQFIVTMHDGGILRFDKNKGHDGRFVWTEAGLESMFANRDSCER